MENDIKLYQSNALTQARYELSVIEKRALYFIIKEVRRQFILSDNGNKDLFNDLVIRMKVSELIGVADDFQKAYTGLKKLTSRVLEFDNDDTWFVVGMINKAKHVKRSGYIDLTIDQDLLPYLVELSKEYTEYSLTVAISLKSQWSQRFYEYCSQFKNAGGFKVSINDLRERLKLEDKYIRYASLKNRVLDVAQKELKKLYEKGECDLYFNYSESKSGRSVTGLTFKIISKTSGEEILSDEDIDYIVRSSLHNMFDSKNKPKNKEFVDRTMGHLRLDPINLKHCYEKINFVKNNLPNAEWQPYLRFIINNEYLK